MGSGIGVLLPVRNGATVIQDALRDLVEQTVPADHVLVVDDGSTDGTREIVERFAASERTVEVISGPGIGLAAALNTGLAALQTEWVARADADDRYPADRLSLQSNAFVDDVVAIVGDYRISLDGLDLGTIPCAVGPDQTALSLVRPVRFPHPGVVYRRHAVIDAGGYRDAEFPAEDLGLWLRLARAGRMVGVASQVLDYQWSRAGVSATKRDAQMSMTRKLLESVGVPKGLVESVADRRFELAAEYDGIEYRDARRAAFASDLVRASGIAGHGRVRSVGVGASVLLRHPRSVAAGIALQRDASRRRAGLVMSPATLGGAS